MNFIGGTKPTKDNATTIGARPEDINIGKQNENGRWRGKIIYVEHSGADTFVHLHNNDIGKITARAGGEDSFAIGDEVVITPRRLYRFDAGGKTLTDE